MLTRGKAVEVLAYMAGIIDGEGYIGITRFLKQTPAGPSPRYIASVSLGMADYETILWFQSEWDGYVYSKTKTHPECRPVWGWQINNKNAHAFLLAILPYLRIKRRQAELLIQYWEGKTNYNRKISQSVQTGQITGHPGAPAEELAFRDSIVSQIRALNYSRPQRLIEAAPRTGDVIV